MTWAELRAECERQLAGQGEERPARLVLDWFDDVFGRASRRATELVPSESAAVAKTQLVELLAGRPLAYVTGVSHFYNYELEISEGVLIPRPETEELVRWILQSHGKESSLAFGDLCTGSGCIAVALALQRLRWTGVAVDVSPYALEVARRNVVKHDLSGHLQVIGADVLIGGLRTFEDRSLDLIVSNPPYIPASDWGRVAPEVADHEPRLALRVPDNDPLIFYRAIASQAKRLLKANAWIYFECNDLYAERVQSLLKVAGYFDVELLVDMQGKPRHVRGRRG